MKELIIEKTSSTPLVVFNPETGQLKIEGRSIPENPGEFFETLLAEGKWNFRTTISLNSGKIDSICLHL